jgi:hypothetical protein
MAAMRQFRGVAHVHSRYSFDGRLTMQELARFFRERHIDFVLLSEHVESLTAETVRAVIADCAALSDESFLLIPGIEIDALNALFYGARPVGPWSSNEELAARLVEGGALAVVSHPIKIHRALPASTERDAAGVEVWNSRHDGKAAPSGRIIRYWRTLRDQTARDLLPLCGIDFHGARDFVPLTLDVECERLDRASILAALRERRFHLSRSGKRVPLDFRSGRMASGYALYAAAYRAAYGLVYGVHRTAQGAGFRVPKALKTRLSKVF